MTVPGHYPDCPVLTGEPQPGHLHPRSQEDPEAWFQPFVQSVQKLVGDLELVSGRSPQEEQLLCDLKRALADYFRARDEIT
jgi:hypothetical protein